MTGDLHQVSKSIGGLEAMMTQVLSSLASLNHEVGAVREDVSDLKVSVGKLSTEVHNLSLDGQTVKERVAVLEGRVDGLRLLRARVYGMFAAISLGLTFISQYLIKALAWATAHFNIL